ncbi:ubiquinol-cytochrome c reductase iron-sulfur subunit [Actinopolymorpha alba]|uniref:cytochrome bc1 complex Rieske iron-sulfur subunit n=1 Tax=Actinopolymorpha alba TaxID=533267 RepID=UPI00036D31E4|nr:Rieske 2Fe-2S domain-containing protein [Actinopolymorpha alba]
MSSDLSSHGEVAIPDASGAGDPIPDPGLPPHEPRLTDVDEQAAKRAERQVATLFGLAALLIIAFVVAYLVVPRHAAFLGFGASNLALGSTLGLALLFIGVGAVQWARRLMDDHEIVEERHSSSSSEQDRAEAIAVVRQGADESGIGRRTLIRRTLIGAVATLGIAPIILLADLGPLPGNKSAHTIWRRGTRIANDVTFKLLRPEDLELGQLVNAVPLTLEDLPEGKERNNARAKASVILVRMEENQIRALPNRKNWGVGGILCYSKVCTHVGCPVNLYERVTRHVLCPCHQSTFDLADNGRVVFGPAARSLPQLPIMVDADGYLVAQSDFTEPVGPSYWERG